MAGEESEGGSAMSTAIFVFGGVILLIIVWYLSGGASRADLRGIFLQPPTPLGNGNAYGPQIGSSTKNY